MLRDIFYTMHFKLIIVLICAVTSHASEQCITPNGESALCISLYSCPTLLNALQTGTNSTIEFVRQSNCGGTSENPLVCCGSAGSFADTKNNKNTAVKKSLLPGIRFCGLQHTDDYIRSSNATGISEFPWIARIQLVDSQESSENNTFFHCSGTLINTKYILTGAHCVVNSRFKPIGVRLGEYNLRNDTDCVHELGVDECSTPVEDYGIEKIVAHPNFSTIANDIALIRLNASVTYSDYIRPICLPTKETQQVQNGDTLITSGWGQLKLGALLSDVKKRIISRLIMRDECAEKWRPYSTVKITDTHLCIILDNNEGETYCNGDGGGPVMFARRFQWYQEGIISLESIPCAKYPEINTRVASFIEWIEDNMEP